MKKSTQELAIVAVSVCLTALVLEVAVRTHHGTLLHFKSLTAVSPRPGGRMNYHARLGWIPRPGPWRATRWTANVDASGFRSNGGRTTSTPGRPILSIGDSFAFGDEVNDAETWPSYLEEILSRRVLNSGVGAYGIDQAVLRAELLLDEFQPEFVVLSFIFPDIDRTEFSYFYPPGAWKPYFELENGTIHLRNVPVPEKGAPRRFPRLPWLRHVLGYSFFVHAVFVRAAPVWWQDQPVPEQVHSDGATISVELLKRLHRVTQDRGAQFIAVALAVRGHNPRLAEVVRRAKENDVRVLDLASETLQRGTGQLEDLFRPNGHYTPAMNRWVAEEIAVSVRNSAAR